MNTRAMSLILTSILSWAQPIPCFAAVSQPPHTPAALPSRPPLSLDLSSTASNLPPPHALQNRPVTINVAGNPFMVTSGTHLTAAEIVAVYQVIHSRQQSIRIAAHGNAVGGSMTIGPRLARDLGSLVVPQGVTVIVEAPALSLAGSLTNSGTLYAVPTSPSVPAATISATTITNGQGALIATLLPPGALPGLARPLTHPSLHLTAAANIVNAGTVTSAKNLTLTAGGFIGNQPRAVLQAASNATLTSQIGTFFNRGSIASQLGSISFSTPATIANMTIDNTGGSLQALHGAINIRDQRFDALADTTLTGGDWLSRQFNVNSPTGSLAADIGQSSGILNVNARDVHFRASTPKLLTGTWNLSGDPVIINTDGSIDISGIPAVSGAEYVAIAAGDITSTQASFALDTSSSTGNGGNIVLAAGATATLGSINTTITGRSDRGGDITLSNLSTDINTASTGANGTGGNLTLLAFSSTAAGPTGGHIALPIGQSIRTGGSGAGQNGDVTIVAEATSTPATPTTIAVGNIDTSGGAPATGNIVLITGTPQATSPAPLILSGGSALPNGTAAIISGTPMGGAYQQGVISTGALTTPGGLIELIAGRNNGSQTTAISTGNITTVPQDATASGPIGGGHVLIMAGALPNQAQAGGLDIHTGNIDTHSISMQPGGPVTIIGPAGIDTGSINTSCAAAENNYGGSGEVTIVAGSYYDSGSGITVTGGINSSCAAQYPSQGAGAATATIVGVGTASDVRIVNPTGPAIDTSATGSNSGAGAVVVATPGRITLENGSGSGAVIDTHASGPNSSGSQVFLASGRTTGSAIAILAANSPGDILTAGNGPLGAGDVWVLTAGGDYTRGYTVNGDSNTNSFTDLCSNQSIGPGTMEITFSPGFSPTGYCPGGYTFISDSSTVPTQINIVETGNKEPLEVPILTTGSGGIELTNKDSFLEATYARTTFSVMKLFSAGPIVAPLSNGSSGQLFGITSLISTTGSIDIFSPAPVSLWNAAVTPGTLSVSSSSAITSYGLLFAGDRVSLSTTRGSNANIALSSGTWWECLALARAVSISADGSGSIATGGPIYSPTLTLGSGSGSISAYSGGALLTNAASLTAGTTGSIAIVDTCSATIDGGTLTSASFQLTDSAEQGQVTVSPNGIRSNGTVALATASGSNGSIDLDGLIAAESITISADGAGNIAQRLSGSALEASSATLSSNGDIGEPGGYPIGTTVEELGFGSSTPTSVYVNNTGPLTLISSSTATNEFSLASSGPLLIGGSISAGTSTSSGRIDLQADSIAVSANTVISASGEGGQILFTSLTGNDPLNVTNDGTIEAAGDLGMIGFNGGSSRAVAVASTGMGTVRAGGYLELGRLDPITLGMIGPYVAVSPPGNFTLGSISVAGQSIAAGVMEVSAPTPQPEGGGGGCGSLGGSGEGVGWVEGLAAVAVAVVLLRARRRARSTVSGKV